jgi:uncharacterized protein (TIGR03437 family)
VPGRAANLKRAWVMLLGIGLTVSTAVAQSRIAASPSAGITFSGTVDDNQLASFTVGGGGGSVSLIGIGAGYVDGVPAKVKFKFSEVRALNPAAPAPPNFVVVSPASGTTPSEVPVGLNRDVLRGMGPGTYALQVVFSTVDQSPPSLAAVLVILRLHAPPAPVIGSVLSSASLQPTISPGELVSIFGTNLGPLISSTQYGVTGQYPATLGDGTVYGNTTVMIGGIAASLLYVSPSQINVVVPYGVAGQKTADVVVTRYGQSTTPLTVPVQDTSPAIFTATQNGSGQGAILNVPPNPSALSLYTYNGMDNPAAKGSVIVLFATGAGVWNPPVQDGTVSLAVTNFQAKPVSLTVGGQPARILYAGAATYEVWGMLQINAFVPDGIGSGPQPMVLAIGQNDNSEQKVTIAIK